MTDLKDLMALALADGHGPDPDQEVTAAGDLARGRALRRRRRAAGLVGGTAVAAGVTAVALSLATTGPAAVRLAPAAGPTSRAVTSPGAGASRSPGAGASRSPAAAAVALVSYSGAQIPGYQVAEVPSGWVLQGGDAFVLVIAPAGDRDTSIDSFIGKLVVMLKSADEPVPTQAPRQPVAGRPGYLRVQDGTQILTFQAANGAWVDIQAPAALGWDGTQLAQFAAGVQVLGNAQPSHG